jgi:hypothetical protein
MTRLILRQILNATQKISIILPKKNRENWIIMALYLKNLIAHYTQLIIIIIPITLCITVFVALARDHLICAIVCCNSLQKHDSRIKL